MSWVVDQRVLGLRNAVVNRLGQVVDQDVVAFTRTQAIQVRTAFVMGAGHAEGDRLVQDAAQTIACFQRALSSVDSAIGEAKQVDIMTWVPED